MADKQSLFDALAGSAGHPVNRPALNAYITQGQAMAGLRSAQTEEALLNAQRAQEEQDANSQLESAYVGMGMKPSDAHAAALISISNHGNAQQALQALQEQRRLAATDVVGDVSKLNTPEQTAAFQQLSGKPLDFKAVPDQYAVEPGITPPVVHASPLGAAKTGEQNALAGLHNAEATNPGAFHPGAANSVPPDAQAAIAQLVRDNPNLAPNLRSLVSNGGWGVAYNLATGHEYGKGPNPTAANPGGAVPGTPTQPIAQGGVTPPAVGGAGSANQPTPGTGITPAPGVGLQEQAHIRNYYAGGQGMNRVMALGTMADHANLFDEVANQLNNGQFTPSNTIRQLWSRLFGAEAPTDLRTVGSFLGREAIRATVNSGAGTGAERELQVDDSSSPIALHGAANMLRTLGAGQYRNLDAAARRGGVDISTLLDPAIRGVFTGQQGGGAGPAEGITAINRTTGQRLIFRGGQWQPLTQ
jgi:hypothetical protein